jgi:hypothetical protein
MGTMKSREEQLETRETKRKSGSSGRLSDNSFDDDRLLHRSAVDLLQDLCDSLGKEAELAASRTVFQAENRQAANGGELQQQDFNACASAVVEEISDHLHKNLLDKSKGAGFSSRDLDLISSLYSKETLSEAASRPPEKRNHPEVMEKHDFSNIDEIVNKCSNDAKIEGEVKWPSLNSMSVSTLEKNRGLRSL